MATSLVKVGWNDPTLAATPTMITIPTQGGWSVDRGRQFEFDRTNTGTAEIDVYDQTGTYDFTNSGTPNTVDILRPSQIQVTHPVSGSVVTVYTGYGDMLEYTEDQSGKVASIRMPLSDGFDILANSEVVPSTAAFWNGSSNTSASTNGPEAVYLAQHADDRLRAAAQDAGWPAARTRFFTMNVNVQETAYQPGSDILQVMQDAVDAEFPGVANLFMGKDGYIVAHGRCARFNPAGFSGLNPPINTWTVGDAGQFGIADAIYSEIVWEIDKERIYNTAIATPEGILNADVAGQLVSDTTSILRYGVRSLPKLEGLLILNGTSTGNGRLAEAKMMAQYYVDNYKVPHPRISKLTFRAKPATAAWSSHWDFLLGVELSDLIKITTSFPGGGGFSSAGFFVEGIHYTASPGNAEFDEIELSLDVSPQAYYSNASTFGCS